MEFNRQSIALLQKIKRLAKEEQGCPIHFDSPNLEEELRLLVRSGVSAELLHLIEAFLPTQAPPVSLSEGEHLYRGSTLPVDDRPRVQHNSVRIYRGRVVSS